MTIMRMVVLVIVMAMVGISVVTLRVEQSRHLRNIQTLQFQQKELRQKIWQQEMELARMLSPQMIRDRASRFGLLSDEKVQDKDKAKVQKISPVRR